MQERRQVFVVKRPPALHAFAASLENLFEHPCSSAAALPDNVLTRLCSERMGGEFLLLDASGFACACGLIGKPLSIDGRRLRVVDSLGKCSAFMKGLGLC
ncbi:MAG: hypothetical protein DYH03_13540 [Nitrospira sp. NTP1]|nr:hypothetical protein [Nitrospira sp. NTP1]